MLSRLFMKAHWAQASRSAAIVSQVRTSRAGSTSTDCSSQHSAPAAISPVSKARSSLLQGIGVKQYSTSTSLELPKPVFELRVYTIKPTKLKNALELFEKNMHLRMKHSELVGYWTTEIGESIHAVAHIWQYDTLSERLKVRKGLLDDAEWQTSFMKNFLPMVQNMRNAVMVTVPGTNLRKDLGAEAGGVYTLEQLASNAPAPGPETSNLVGRFLAVLGPTGTEYRLWRHKDVDAALASSWNNVKESPNGSISNVLLHPSKFSPLQ